MATALHEGPATLDLIGQGVTPATFYDPVHAQVWAELAAMREDGISVTTNTLAARFPPIPARRGDLDQAGVRSLIATLPTPSMTPKAVGAQLLDLARRRMIIANLEHVREIAYAPNGDIDAALARLTDADTSDEWELMSFGALMDAPDPVAIVPGLLFDESEALLFGPPGSGKSFVAISLAVALSGTGTWCGEMVEKGKVLYVAGEGKPGLKNRVRVACDYAGVDPEGLDAKLLGDMPHLIEAGQVQRLRSLIRRHHVDYVIIDTLARASLGAEENSSRDMGLIMEAMRSLRTAGARMVLAIHHTGKSGTTDRGSSAIRGAADTMIKCTKGNKGRITLSTFEHHGGKQKDAAERSIYLKLDSDSEGSTPWVSLDTSARPHDGALDDDLHRVLEALRTECEADGVTSLGGTNWRRATLDAGVTKPRHDKARNVALEAGYVVQDGTGHRAPYQLTATGEAFLSTS